MSIENALEDYAESTKRIADALENILALLKNAEPRVTEPVKSKPGRKPRESKQEDQPAEGRETYEKEEIPEKEEVLATKAFVAVNYDSIKAVVTEMAGTPDGVTAIKEVLKSFNAKKASDVPEEKWKELLSALEKANNGSIAQDEFA